MYKDDDIGRYRVKILHFTSVVSYMKESSVLKIGLSGILADERLTKQWAVRQSTLREVLKANKFGTLT